LGVVFSCFHVFIVIGIFQTGFGILGFIGGRKFLELKAWSRDLLEILTWFVLILIPSWPGLLMYFFMRMERPRFDVFDFMMMGMAMSMLLMHMIPIGIMLKYLRSATVRNAMEPADRLASEA